MAKKEHQEGRQEAHQVGEGQEDWEGASEEEPVEAVEIWECRVALDEALVMKEWEEALDEEPVGALGYRATWNHHWGWKGT
jgi:hypothetical protein